MQGMTQQINQLTEKAQNKSQKPSSMIEERNPETIISGTKASVKEKRKMFEANLVKADADSMKAHREQFEAGTQAEVAAAEASRAKIENSAATQSARAKKQTLEQLAKSEEEARPTTESYLDLVPKVYFGTRSR